MSGTTGGGQGTLVTVTSMGLTGRLQRIVYGDLTPESTSSELRLMTQVDLAHVVMLTECGLLSSCHAATLVRGIRRLRQQDFEALHRVAMPRGLYLAYEQHLIAVLGPDVGGRLHTGRSRNDLKATTTALRLRSALLDLLAELTRLQAVLLSRARCHHDTVMPIYTHYQPAMPTSYGYYLLGMAIALGRDVTALIDAGQGLRHCPMGAGAVVGTDLPLEPARTAALLGFESGPVHALDAVASRDVPLRVLAAASGAGLTLSRLATDLQLWSTAEFGFIEFPDRLVGGSSAMPQKRNAFLLEHVKAKSAAAIGAWTAAASAVKSAPFTNSIEVGTEAVAAVWPGLAAINDTVLLAQALVSGARPHAARMLARAEDSFVTATVLANRLVRRGVPFRTAHEMVGTAVRRAIDSGARRLSEAGLPPEIDPKEPLDQLISMHRTGGGTGAFEETFAATRAELLASRNRLSRTRAKLGHAAAQLAAATGRLADQRESVQGGA